MAAIPEFLRETARFRPRPVPSISKLSSSKSAEREDIVPALEAVKGVTDALYITGGQLIVTSRASIHTMATAAQLPTTYNDQGVH